MIAIKYTFWVPMSYVDLKILIETHPLAWVFFKALFIILIATVLHYFIARRYNKIIIKLRSSKKVWDDALVESLHFPVVASVWIVALFLEFELLAVTFTSADFGFSKLALKMGILAISLYFAWTFLKTMESRLTNAPVKLKHADETAVVLVSKILKVCIAIVGVVTFSGLLGYSPTALYVLVAPLLVGISLSLKDYLANIFGGVMIFLEPTFKIGDWIRSPDRKIEGTVEAIGWRYVKVRTFDQRPLYVPSSTLSTIIVENASRMRNRRITANVGVRYQDAEQINAITTDIEAYLRENPEIDKNRTLFVCFNEFAP